MNRIILCVLAVLVLSPISAYATSSSKTAMSAEEINTERQRAKDAAKAEKELNSIMPDDYGEFNDFMAADTKDGEKKEEPADSTRQDDKEKERSNVRQVYKPQPNLAMRRAIKDDRVDDGYVQGLIEQRAIQQDLAQ